MLKSPVYKVSSIVKNSVGLLLFLICSIAIYNKVLANEDWNNLQQVFASQLSAIHIWEWLVLFFLMFANLLAESIKWKLVVATNNPIGILAALKSVFVGQAFAFFTPNRIGEYAGRTLFLSSGNKLMGLAQMAWTSYAQLLITICIGSVALFINISHYPWMHSISMIGVQLLSPLVALFALIFYLYQRTWKGWLRIFNVIQISNPIKFQLLGWSLLRYFIFIGQYFWVAYLFQMQVPFTTIFLSLSILFLLLSILPTISITELVVRGQLLIMILAPFYTHKITIVALSSIIWSVNFLIPSIIGTILLLGYRIKK